jgi:hypothetical protein
MEGKDFIDLMKLMPSIHPEERITLREALNHLPLNRANAPAGFCSNPAAISDAARETNRKLQRQHWLKKQHTAEIKGSSGSSQRDWS